MLVTEVYVKAGWEIVGGDDDAEGRARKSEFEAVSHSDKSLLGSRMCNLTACDPQSV